jgi:hypothetical protein
MSLSLNSIPVRVRAHLASRGADVSNLRDNRILALVPDALRLLSERGFLRKTFVITAVNGVVDLAAPLTAAEPLILERIREAQVTFPDFTYALQWKADRSSLSFPASSEFGYVAVEDKTLLIATSDGLGVYDGTGSLRNAPYVPLLSSVPVTLEAAFIALVSELAHVPAQMARTQRG